jgi:hypothetical protein
MRRWTAGLLLCGVLLWGTPGHAQILFGGATAGGTPAVQTMPGGALYGCTVSNNAGDLTNDLDIARCEATSDDAAPTARVILSTSATVTKQTDVAWAAGSAAGGLCTGEVVGNGTWFLWAFQRSGGLTDFCVSTTLAPTLPDGGTKKRILFAFLRAAAAITAFVQDGDLVSLAVPVNSVSQVNPGTAAVLRTLTVPLGVSVVALVTVGVTDTTPIGPCVALSDPATTDTAASVGVNCVLRANAAGTVAASMRVRTDTSGRIRSRLSASDANVTFTLGTLGWIFTRGQTHP